MARVELITERHEHLTDAQKETFDAVVASRGQMIRPFEVLTHTPVIGGAIADVGGKLRYGSLLSDHDRELLTLTVGADSGCTFVWDSHIDLGQRFGVREEVLAHLRDGAEVTFEPHEDLVVSSVRQLLATRTVDDEHFEALVELYGVQGAVEFSATVGYYVLLATVMGFAQAC